MSPNFYIVNRGLDATRRFENRYPKIVQTNLPMFFGGPEAPSVGPQPQLGYPHRSRLSPRLIGRNFSPEPILLFYLGNVFSLFATLIGPFSLYLASFSSFLFPFKT